MQRLFDKKMVGIYGVVLVLLFFQFHSVEAAVTVTPLKMEQGNLLVATIPQFENGLEAKLMSGFNESYRQEVLVAFNKFEAVAFQLLASPTIPDHMKKALTFHADYGVYRNDSQFVSLAQQIYQYTGGAHGMSWMTASTIQLLTGRECSLQDLFIDGADFAARLNEVVRREGAARKLPLWGFKGVQPESAFYLTDEGLVLFFQQYEIAPYSEGLVRMLVPYRDLADILQTGVGK